METLRERLIRLIKEWSDEAKIRKGRPKERAEIIAQNLRDELKLLDET